jgi:nucleoside-diphosphate-sugar epimerase
MSTTLLTGASGFVALHVLDALLAADYTVVATVRSKSKGNLVREVAKSKGHNVAKVIIAYVPDMSVDGAYDHVLKAHPAITTVVHTASPFRYDAQDAEKEILGPAINGTTNMLQAVKKLAPQITQVVFTSSIVAIIDLRNPGDYRTVHSEKSWNPVTIEEAKTERGFAAYSASKTYAERAFWEFFEKENPNFIGTSVNPPLVFGPNIGSFSSPEALNESSKDFYEILIGKLPLDFGLHQIDVRDLATAHVLALQHPEVAKDKRWFVTAGPFLGRQVVQAVTDADFPEYKNVLQPLDGDAEVSSDVPRWAVGNTDTSKWYTVNNSSTMTDLQAYGFQYKTLEETSVDTAKSFIDMKIVQ